MPILREEPPSPAGTCARIHSALEALPAHHGLSSDVPEDGLYFFYESGESNGHDGGPRIVRVGNHPRRPGGLPNRLRNHFSGTKNGSVFRKYLGGALMRRENPNNLCLAPAPGKGHWEKQEAKPCERCRHLEREVSQILRERFWYRCVQIEEREERNRMEEGLVASLAECPRCQASSGWLGSHTYSVAVRESGLWNSEYVGGSPRITDAELRRFETLVRGTVDSRSTAGLRRALEETP